MQRAAQSCEAGGERAAGDIGALPRAWSEGNRSALDRLTPIAYDEVYDKLRRLGGSISRGSDSGLKGHRLARHSHECECGTHECVRHKLDPLCKESAIR